MEASEKKEKFYLCASDDKNYEIVKSREVPKTTYHGGRFWSRGIAHESLEALKEYEGVLDKPCCKCGGVVAVNKRNNKDKLVEANACSSCLFWLEIIETKFDKRRLFIDGTAYFLRGKNDSPYNHAKGFGGRKFRIEKDNGEVLETTDLWHNGEIPERFRKELKNNAKFLPL